MNITEFIIILYVEGVDLENNSCRKFENLSARVVYFVRQENAYIFTSTFLPSYSTTLLLP